MEIFQEKLIFFGYVADNKKEMLFSMCKLLREKGIIDNKEAFFAKVMEREDIMSTGVGMGLAMPHGRSEAALSLSTAVFCLEKPLEYDAIDGEPVKIVMLTAVPTDRNKDYIKSLQAISFFYQNEENRKQLLEAKNARELYKLLQGINDEE